MGSSGRWTRRTFLVSGAAACGLHGQPAKTVVFESDWRRYPDPTTEFEVLRLTDPAYESRMPAYYSRGISHRAAFMLFSSDRAGSLQILRMDLKTGQSRQLTNAHELDPESVALTPDDRGFCYFDGPALRMMSLGMGRDREVYRVPEGWQHTAGASLSADGVRVVFAESKEGAARVRSVSLARGAAETIAEQNWAISEAQMHPRRAQILYRQGDEALWLVNLDGKQNHKLKLADGHIGPARWSPDGRTVIYLHFPDDRTQLHAIREHAPDQSLDKMVGKTSQFAHFGFNANSSVFVGASQNKASPTILLLLRVTRRELTMCEHKASDPGMVAPVFSPDSQRVYFQSDRHGKRAIYMVRVDKFVEKTDGET
jgi:oligogalacturonide lyase